MAAGRTPLTTLSPHADGTDESRCCRLWWLRQGGLGVWGLWAVVVWAAVGAAGFRNLPVTSACGRGLPGHVSLGPQTSTPPYRLTVTPGNHTWRVVLEGRTPFVTFRGFLVQTVSDQRNSTGRFVLAPDNMILRCCYHADAVQHRKAADKHRVTLLWQDLDYVGAVQFRATVVQDYMTYWTNVQSQPHFVNPEVILDEVASPFPAY